MNRFFLLAVWVVIVSLISVRILVSEDIQMGILLAGSGIGWLISGGISLFVYLNETQPASPELDV
jgi:uncharacterized membrane protein